MIRIFLGFDDRQLVAYTVLHASLLRYATKPIAITPLVLETLPIRRRGLTPFTYSRFLVPSLCNYEGKAVFMDSDMLALADVSRLLELAEGEHDLWCVKNPLRFEWSSLMVFDNARCRALTPEFIEDPTRNPLKLDWASSVGDLPGEWNHLVGYDEQRIDARIVHFTQGLPCHDETRNCEYSGVWREAKEYAEGTLGWQELMGRSVHAAPVMKRLANAA